MPVQVNQSGERDQPAAQPRPLPGARGFKIALRTGHLMATSVLVGGCAFAAPSRALLPWLYAATLTGVGMTWMEAYPSLSFLSEGWGLMLIAKLALLCAMPFAHGRRFALLLAAVAIASIGSHMPRRLRHYSLLRKNVSGSS